MNNNANDTKAELRDHLTRTIATDLERLCIVYSEARWPWDRWAVKHAIFVKVWHARRAIIAKLREPSK